MNLINFKNKLYSVIYEEKSNIVVASIPVHGGRGEGKTKDDALMDLRINLGKLETSSNLGKNKLLFG